MNDLQLFKFENKRIRSLCIDGEPWFVGKDVAKTLGYSNLNDALTRHVDEDDKTVTKCDTSGGTQEMTIINESGLYSLILSSKLPSAKAFIKRRASGQGRTGSRYDDQGAESSSGTENKGTGRKE